MNKIKLDKDEQEILKSFERGEWKSVKNVKKEILKHQQYARNTLKKDKRVNIRISSKVLEEIQALAVENGIPYQTFMSSVLHRYVSGYLIEKPRPIGIGLPITEEPSHTTWHTDRYLGGSADQAG